MKISPILIIFSFSIWLLSMFFAVAYYLWSWLHTPIVLPEKITIYEVRAGMSVNSIARDFSGEGIIRWPELWTLYARFADKTHIQKGEYQFNKWESPKSILKKFNSGDVVQHKVTLVEGMTFQDYLKILNRVDAEKSSMDYEELLQKFKSSSKEFTHPEGWFFPDTYSYTKGDTALDILFRAYEKMQITLHDLWENRDGGLPYKNPYEALIMASIIEKETGAAHERSKIAGVFVRRLEKNMRLQTDPTVIYGMGDSYKGNITRKDLRTATPYNTYVIRGLPPTPIAMPGKEAIFAALHPESGDELYFVAKGDGTHKFSVTLEEHEVAVKEYQLKRKKGYRSSISK